jgi:membrane protein
LFSESFAGWSRNQASLYAAALAFYTIFSLAPLAVISVGIAGLVFNRTAVEGDLVEIVEEMAGAQIARLIQDILLSYVLPSRASSGLATLIGLGVMIYGASIIFSQLRLSLNAMWEIVPKAVNLRQNILVMIKNHLLSAAAAISMGVYLLVALILNNLWAALPTESIRAMFPGTAYLVPLLTFVISPVLYWLPFALIYKLLPQAKVRWRDVGPGAALAAILFWIGGQLIGLYLTRSSFTSVYGAAGSLVALLIWVYYSAQIFLFGAKFTQFYAELYGLPITPARNATFKTGLAPHPNQPG